MKEIYEQRDAQRRTANIWLMVGVGNLLLILIPVLIKLNLSLFFLLFGFLTVLSFIIAPIFYSRASVLSRMADPINIIVKWECTIEEFPWMEENRIVLVTNEGLYYNKEINTFKKFACKLEYVRKGVLSDTGHQTLDFTISIPNGQGGSRIKSVIQIPIPKNKIVEAKSVLERFTDGKKVKKSKLPK